MKHLITLFTTARSIATLRDSEKAFHRAQLLSHMRTHVSTPSPYLHTFIMGLRYVSIALIVCGISGGGVTLASAHALPGNPLYAVRIAVTEPVQLALTFNSERKAALAVDIVDRRLKDIAEASLSGDLDPVTLKLASDSLSSTINAAQDTIGTLQDTDNADTAFEAASDLEATLSVHTKILKKVQGAAPVADSGIQTIAKTLATESTETRDILASTTEALSETDPDALATGTDAQQDDLSEALSAIKEHLADALSSLDMSDRADLEEALQNINAHITEADAADSAGHAREAYILYTEAEQQLTELTTLLDADQTLNIDVIDASSTDTSSDHE